jgi:uncharacterized protein YecA (UPF0149 family)
VKVLARQGDRYVDRILDRIGKKIVDVKNDPMLWMESFAIELAGEMRLEAATPLIVEKLHDEEDVAPEVCIEALSKIGTDAAVEAVVEGWPEAGWSYRVSATSVLADIHSDLSVRKCQELLALEKDLDIKTWLALAFLGQFAEESIEPVREIILREEYDPGVDDLKEHLAAISVVVGVSYPEYLVWKQEAEERLAKEERRMEQARLWKTSPPPPASKPKSAPAIEQDNYPDRTSTPCQRTEKHVGRNDPCPCGSGKKFKKCCMKGS